jgi:hypothetical protein
MIIYAFDVDDTLEVSNGPITLQSMMNLRVQGHIVGLCGNWHHFVKNVPSWQNFIAFMNVAVPNKDTFLDHLRVYVPADDHVLVGNIIGVSGGSDDQGAAQRTGWRFIKESDFAAGAR